VGRESIADESAPERGALVVMGVSGSGKSTIAAAIAARAGALFLDADDFHPSENTAKMAAGSPLSDDDRRPWLAAVGDEIARRTAEGDVVVMACSSLKRSYRDTIREHAGAVTFAHLNGGPELLAMRVGQRVGHFMPPSLLATQLEILEQLQPDERGFTVDIDASPDRIVDAVMSRWWR
jgi:gluconokinase